MSVASAGIMSVARKSVNTIVRPRKRIRAKAYPASTAVATSAKVVTAATAMVLRKPVAQFACGWFQASTQFSGCHEAGMSVGGNWPDSAKVLNDVVTIQ